MERKLRVILADGNNRERESKKKCLEANGIDVIYDTDDGRKALDEIRTQRPDIVIMDLILPSVDGMGILEECMEMDHFYRPHFIIETAMRGGSMVEQAFEYGADYYLIKPVSASVLVKRILQLEESALHTSIDSVAKAHAMNFQLDNLEKNEKESRFTGDLEVDITNILLEIGIPAHIKGYQYIREGIMLAFQDSNMLHYITKFLYPTIAKKYKTTSSSVERTIRHAIEVAWRRGDMDTLEEFFGNTISAGKGKPTNSEFMALLTDKLRLEYRLSHVG